MSTQHPKTRRRRCGTLLALLLALAMFATACGGDDGGDAFDQSAGDTADESSGADGADGSGSESGDDSAADPSEGDGTGDSGDSGDEATASDGDEAPDDTDDGDNESDTDGDSDGRTLADADIPTGGDGFCGDFWAYLQSTVDLLNVMFSDEPAKLEAAAGPMRESIAAIEDSVPGDLFDEMVLANQPFVMMLDALETYGWDFDTAAADPATQMEKTPEITAAEDAVYQYAVDECGYDPESMGLTPPS